jgi:16S rRNA (cytosine967-C5)-methyltransferase
MLAQTKAVAETLTLLLWQVLVNRKPADRVLAAHLRDHREFGSRDRRLISELAYGVFRWYGWLAPLVPLRTATLLETATAAPGANRRDAAMPENPIGRPEAWIPLLLTVLELERLDAPAIRDFWRDCCKLRRDAIASLATLPPRERAEHYLLAFERPRKLTPEMLLPEWARSAIPETERPRFTDWLQTRPPLWLRLQRGEPDAVLAELAEAGLRPRRSERLAGAVSIHNPRVNLYLLPAYREGRVEIQDLASQAVGAVCAPSPGQRWWDACAGAGGKSLLLAQLMQGRGTVVASDVRAEKLDDLRKRARRSGFSNITPRVWDGKPLAAKKATCDGVLADAPCTCSGTWRRNPAARWSTAPDEAAAFPARQLEILAAAATAVKPGGVLVYATCSVFTAENEGVVAAFLAARPEFRLEPVPHPLTGQPTDGQAMLWPWQGDCDALFAARFRRQGG